jgi:phosphoribosyl 1,2-cyclic phosphodiesterase
MRWRRRRANPTLRGSLEQQGQLGLFAGVPEPPLRVVVLGSGSGGNALVVEHAGHRLLVDAGFSARELERRLRRVGVAPDSLDALILTHEHQDHVCGADRLARRHHLPLYATAGTLEGTRLCDPVRRGVEVIRSGVPFAVGRFEVRPFAVPHDAREPVGLRIADALGRSVGVVADLGARTQLAWEALREVDVLVLETNHDLDLLRTGPYPWSLKQRVASRHGHLSNHDAARGVVELVHDRLQFVVLYHLSRTNNRPGLAAGEVGERLASCGAAAQLVLSEQFEPTPWLEVSA